MLTSINDPKPTTPAALARTRDACAYLNVGRTTLRRMVQAGKLKPVQIGPRAVGYRYSDLDAYIASVTRG